MNILIKKNSVHQFSVMLPVLPISNIDLDDHCIIQ